MLEIRNPADVSETQEQKSDVNGFLDIHSEGETNVEECRGYWDSCFRAEFLNENDSKDYQEKPMHEYLQEPSESDKPDKKGGSYDEVKGEKGVYEAHHVPADSISPLERKDGPVIKMEVEDHQKTASWGSSKEAAEYRAAQKELIDQGKFREAIEMDIEDIRDKFADKYDDAIVEMLDYVKQIAEEGLIDG